MTRIFQLNRFWFQSRFFRLGMLCILLISATKFSAQEADSSVTKTASSKEMCISFGLLYSNLTLDSEPFFADSAGKVGYSNINNGGGLSLGLAYNLYPGKYFLFRPGLETVILSGNIAYDTDINHQKKSNIWPVALEVPLTLIYSRNIHSGVVADKRTWPEIGLGIRPAIALEYFFDMRPTMKTFNLNADLVVGLPLRWKKANARIELIYSHGFNNLIGVDDDDLYTYIVNDVRRSYFGLRLVLN